MKNQQRQELAICGFESVTARADKNPDTITRFFCSNSRVKAFGSLCAYLAKQKKQYRVVDDAELQKLCGSVHHQGLVAMVQSSDMLNIDLSCIEMWVKNTAKLLLLDNVGDDHNIGSIARSAVFFGWHAIIVTGNRTKLSTSAYRIARGALEHIPVYRAESAASFIQLCRNKIQVIAADHNGDLSLSDIHQHLNKAKAKVLVLGNEETGLSQKVKASCNYLVKIQGSSMIESLNVSQAAAVLLYALS